MATYSCPSCETFGVHIKIKRTESHPAIEPPPEDTKQDVPKWGCPHCGWEGTTSELNRGLH